MGDSHGDQDARLDRLLSAVESIAAGQASLSDRLTSLAQSQATDSLLPLLGSMYFGPGAAILVELGRAMQGAQNDEGFDKEVLLGSVNLAREILLQSHSANLKNATVVALLQGLTREDREKAKGVEGKDAARSLVMSRVTAVPNPAPPRQRPSQGPSRNDWDALKALMPSLKRTLVRSARLPIGRYVSTAE
ncbi:hypothetical protein BSKO_08126 [Bryopsis sp. KO-2023]|nr:hypothetical protein BSKO_08126 [Bryopsis sp. KO-2023]